MRRLLSGALLCAVVIAVLNGCAFLLLDWEELLYSESFSNTANNDWPLQDTDKVRKWFEGGKYQFEVQEDTHSVSKCSAAGEFDDLKLVADAQFISGTQNKSVVGLVFRFVDWENYYEFLVSPAGTFKLRKQLADAWVDIEGWTSHDAIRQGVATNTLAVIAEGSSITCYVNEEEVFSTSDSSFASGQIGLVAVSYSGNTVMRAAFDDVEVYSVGY